MSSQPQPSTSIDPIGERHAADRPLRNLTEEELEALRITNNALSEIAGAQHAAPMRTLTDLAWRELTERDYERNRR